MLGVSYPQDFIPGHRVDEGATERMYLVFHGMDPLVHAGEPWRAMQEQEWKWSGLEPVYEPYCIGTWGGVACMAVSATGQLPQDWQRADMRSILQLTSPESFSVLSRARQTLEWLRTRGFCSICGGSNVINPNELALQCSQCQALHYPRISPCVIVLVTRGEEALLGRNANFPPGMFSTLAGFLEPGESAETAVVREVQEETGVLCGNLRYFASQPWPFPSQLMLGFHAEYVSGEARPDEVEIVEANWWRYDELPRVPPPSSISGALIADWVERMRTGKPGA